MSVGAYLCVLCALCGSSTAVFGLKSAKPATNPGAETPSPEGNPKSEGRNPKAEIAKLSGIGSALNTEATGASVSRSDRTE